MKHLRRVPAACSLIGALCLMVAAAAPPVASGSRVISTPPDTFFYGVACASASYCEAVGQQVPPSDPSAARSLAEHWNGSKWAAQEVPAPKVGSEGLLRAVACPSTKSCFAVGTYNVSSRTTAPLAEHWNGSKWAVESLSEPKGSDGDLQAVSCKTADSCMAVGYYESPVGNEQNLGEYWNGSRWSAQRPKDASTAESDIPGVACPTTKSCFAVGRDFGDQVTFADHWNGRTWAVQPTPNPASMVTPQLNAVACRGKAKCMAVGTSDNGVETYNLAESWNGSKWRIVKTTDPSTDKFADNELAAVSCPTICVAVGYDVNETNTIVTLAELWNGSKWTTSSIPDPTSGAENELTAVACATSSNCMAVGYSQDSSFTAGATIAEQWSGSKWKVVPTPAL